VGPPTATVGTAGAETLAEGFRVGESVREVQQRLEDGSRLRVGTRGIDADVGRSDRTDPIEESRGESPRDPAGTEGLEENDGRREGPLAAEDGPRGAPPRVEVVRGVRVDPRELYHVLDLDPGPPRGRRQVEPRAGRRGAARLFRLVPSDEVTGDPTPVVAGRRQLDRQGALRVGHVDERRARQDVVEGRHQRRADEGVIHEAEVGATVTHLAATPHHGDRRSSVVQGRYEGVRNGGNLLGERVGGAHRVYAPERRVGQRVH